MNTKSLIQYAVAGALTFSLGLSSAWALTEDEAHVQIEKHAAEKRLDAEDRAAAFKTLNALVQMGVPVERAYDVVEAAIDKDIKGPELADITKYIEDRHDAGTTMDAAAAEAVSRIEHETFPTVDTPASSAIEMSRSGVGMGGSEAGAGAGMGMGMGGSEAGAGAGMGMGIGGSEAGAGAGMGMGMGGSEVGAGAGAGMGGGFGAGNR